MRRSSQLALRRLLLSLTSSSYSAAKPLGTSLRRPKNRSKRLSMTPKTNSVIEPLLTPDEVAQVLKTSVKTVYRRIKSGALPAIRDGRVVRIRPADLRLYIAARRQG